jgi:hypothetical protein
VIRLVVAAACAVGFTIAISAQETPRLQGDPQAVAAIERMLERLGGQAVWARTRTLYVEYDGWRTRPNEPVVERAWRDLAEPRQRAEYQGRSFLTTYGLSPERGWIDRDGKLEVYDAERHAATVERYPFGFYSSLRTLAVADSRIRLAWQEPDRVIVRTADGRERGWWQIDSTGAPIRWGAGSGDTAVEYVYGPVRPFGTVNFPAWGASRDGWWRWDYVRIEPSPSALDVSLDPPAPNP